MIPAIPLALIFGILSTASGTSDSINAQPVSKNLLVEAHNSGNLRFTCQ